MGGAASRPQDDEEPPQGGVRVTAELLEQLQGRRPARRRVHPSGAPLLSPDVALERDLARLGHMDAALGRALEGTRRVGDLLLKREAEDTAAAAALAAELLARPAAAPAPRPPPCRAEAAECLRCYEAHAGDEARCAAAVGAYSACARAAWLARGGAAAAAAGG